MMAVNHLAGIFIAVGHMLYQLFAVERLGIDRLQPQVAADRIRLYLFVPALEVFAPQFIFDGLFSILQTCDQFGLLEISFWWRSWRRVFGGKGKYRFAVGKNRG